MKHVIIALSLATAVLSFGAKASPCAQIISETPMVTSGAVARMSAAAPAETNDLMLALNVACEAAYTVGKQGLPPEAVTLPSVKRATANSPLDSLMSATHVSVMLTAWAAGAEDVK